MAQLLGVVLESAVGFQSPVRFGFLTSGVDLQSEKGAQKNSKPLNLKP